MKGTQSLPPVVTVNNVRPDVNGNIVTYAPNNPPPYPVTSVNGKTAAVNLSAADVGARADDWMPTAEDVGALSDTDTTLMQAGKAADAKKVGEELNAKVNQSDALTLEEILASTDLTNKVASAEAVKSIKYDVGSLKQSGFYSEKYNNGNTMPADYGGFVRISGNSWPKSFIKDTYYLGVASDGTAYSGTQINGATQITWTAL